MVGYQIGLYGYVSDRCVCINVAGLILTLRSSLLSEGLTVLKFLHEIVIKSIEKTLTKQLIEL